MLYVFMCIIKNAIIRSDITLAFKDCNPVFGSKLHASNYYFLEVIFRFFRLTRKKKQIKY